MHMAQLMPLPLTISCFSKIQIGFAFLVLAHPGSPGQRAVKRVCVYYYVLSYIADQYWLTSVRSASSRFHSAIRRHQFASVRWADSRLTRLVPPNLELALTLLNPNPVTGQKGKTRHPRGSDWTAYSNVAVHRMRPCSRDFRCRRSRSRCTRRCHSETCRRKVAQASLSFTDQHKWATSSFPLIIILIIINVLV